MAFQVIDDILDATSDTETMGKTVRLDAADGKLTYVNLYGIEKSREIAADFSNKAIEACKKLTGKDDSFLKDLIIYMQNRIN